MKRISLIFLIFFAVGAYADILKQVNLPADWKIEKVETDKNVPVGEIEVSVVVKQTISTPAGELIVNYYGCKDLDTASKLFTHFFENQQAAYPSKNMVYTLSGDPVAIKNTLRFLELPLLEQVKTVFPDISELQNARLIAESALSESEVAQAVSDFGIKIKAAKKQLYTFENSKARLAVTYFFCENKTEARSGFQTARMKKKDELINFMFSEDFLIQLQWVK